MKIPMYLIVFMVLLVGAGYLMFFNIVPESKIYEDITSPVMYFYQDTCSHCIAMIPIQTKLATEGYRVKPMDAGRNQAYWSTYGISGTPTWLAPSGESLIGRQTESVLRDFLERNGARIAQPVASTV